MRFGNAAVVLHIALDMVDVLFATGPVETFKINGSSFRIIFGYCHCLYIGRLQEFKSCIRDTVGTTHKDMIDKDVA